MFYENDILKKQYNYVKIRLEERFFTENNITILGQIVEESKKRIWLMKLSELIEASVLLLLVGIAIGGGAAVIYYKYTELER